MYIILQSSVCDINDNRAILCYHLTSQCQIIFVYHSAIIWRSCRASPIGLMQTLTFLVCFQVNSPCIKASWPGNKSWDPKLLEMWLLVQQLDNSNNKKIFVRWIHRRPLNVLHTGLWKLIRINHYIDVIMTTVASQITSLAVVCLTVYSDADQRKHQSSASLAFVWGIHWDRTKGQLRGKCFHLMTSSWIVVETWKETCLTLTHWGRDKMDVISQTTLWSAFSWMKMFEFRLKFHWRLFVRVQLTIFQHWFR